MAVIDSIISAFIVTIIYLICHLESFRATLEVIGVTPNTINLPYDALFLLVLSLIVSTLTVTIVMFSIKRRR